jgi:hypothetical protein
MKPAKELILTGLLLVPCLLPAQSLEIVSRSDAGSMGESNSGADNTFIEQTRPAATSQ